MLNEPAISSSYPFHIKEKYKRAFEKKNEEKKKQRFPLPGVHVYILSRSQIFLGIVL
jgi:hypothetical protein